MLLASSVLLQSILLHSVQRHAQAVQQTATVPCQALSRKHFALVKLALQGLTADLAL
jgi:hypothetical protein